MTDQCSWIQVSRTESYCKLPLLPRLSSLEGKTLGLAGYQQARVHGNSTSGPSRSAFSNSRGVKTKRYKKRV